MIVTSWLLTKLVVVSFYSILAAVENKLNRERREFAQYLVVQTVSLSFSFFEHKSDIT